MTFQTEIVISTGPVNVLIYILAKDDGLIDIANKDGMTPLAAVFDAAIKSGSFNGNQINLIK